MPKRTAGPPPPSVRTQDLADYNHPPQHLASPMSYYNVNSNISPVKSNGTPAPLLYDIPIPPSPNPTDTVEGGGGEESESIEGSSTSGHPFIDSGYRRALSQSSRERPSGNARAYMQARSGTRPITTRSRSTRRDMLESVGQRSTSRHQDVESFSTTRHAGSYLENTRPPLPARRVSAAESSHQYVNNAFAARTRAPRLPPRSNSYHYSQPPAVPLRQPSSISPSKHGDLLSPSSISRAPSREESVNTVGQHSIAGSYVKRDGGVGTPNPAVSALLP